MSHFAVGRYPRISPAATVGLLLLLVGIAGQARADDWPRYRGANGDGISAEKGWSADLSGGKPKELWRKSVGIGASSFSVAKGKVYTQGNVSNVDITYGLDAETGNEIWKFTHPIRFNANSFDGGTMCTPTVDADRVYTLSYDGYLACVNAATGAKMWDCRLGDFGGKPSQYNYVAAPTIEGDRLLIDAGGGASTLCLDKMTGKMLWKSGNQAGGYGGVVVATIAGTRTAVVLKSKELVGVAVADGQQLWRFPWNAVYDINAITPIIIGDNVFITSGYGRGGAMLQIAGGQAKSVWENKSLACHTGTPVFWQGHLYGFTGNMGGGKLVCVEAQTGKTIWSQQGLGTGSFMLADGKLIIMTETSGELVIADASPAAFHALGRVKVLDKKCWVVPVLANGRIYCRNNQGDVVALDVKGK